MVIITVVVSFQKVKHVISYWEKNTWLSGIDVCIIGSGIVGLSTALYLKKQFPSKKILVLERGVLPSGASTKNAGFACFGSLGEIGDDMEKMPEEQVIRLIERRWKGLLELRKNLGDEALDYREWGGYELFTPGQESLYESCTDRLDRFNMILHEITGREGVYTPADRLIAAFGFDKVQHLIFNSAEGQLDTGRMMDALIRLATSMGVHIICGTEVKAWQEHSDGVLLETVPFGTVKTGKVVIATNGFARQLLPGLDVDPARAQVLITTPVEGLPFKGTFHYDRGYYYFRNIGRRILFGGGRNLDFGGETTWSHEITELIQEELERILREVIIPGKPFSVEQRWAGTMGLGPVKEPVIRFVGEHTLCAVRMGGMGVAIGSLVGQEAAGMIAQRF